MFRKIKTYCHFHLDTSSWEKTAKVTPSKANNLERELKSKKIEICKTSISTNGAWDDLLIGLHDNLSGGNTSYELKFIKSLIENLDLPYIFKGVYYRR
jgi:hypothetical protein